MSLSDNDKSYLRKLVKHFKSFKPASVRLKQFFTVCPNDGYVPFRYHGIPDRIWIKLLSCKGLFPSVGDKKKYFGIAVTKRKLKWIKILGASGFKIHEVALRISGRSAVHYLAESPKGCLKYNYSSRTRHEEALVLLDYFLENARKNHRDEQGYTYLHAACVAGNAQAARRLLRSRGAADVDCDSFDKYTALQAAAWYRHEDVVEILLEAGADPNRPNAEGSTPLHSLSWVCLCECESSRRYCDKRKPCEKIVRMLVEAGADIEARNRHGDTALQAAVSRFDMDLTRALLKHGASLSSLNEERMFRGKFKLIELKAYPLALNVIETLQLLQSAGYEVDLLTRLRMIKCWMRVRGYVVDDEDETNEDFDQAFYEFYIHQTFSFYMEQKKVEDFWRQCVIPPQELFSIFREIDGPHASDLARTKEIMLTEDVSLYQVCQMNYSKGYSALKNMKNWSLPPMNAISCTRVNIIAKRHLANIFIRPHLELFAADLFMTDYCKLDLPYTACRGIAEQMSDEDILRLCEQTSKKSLVLPLPTP